MQMNSNEKMIWRNQWWKNYCCLSSKHRWRKTKAWKLSFLIFSACENKNNNSPVVYTTSGISAWHEILKNKHAACWNSKVGNMSLWIMSARVIRVTRVYKH